MGEKYKCHLFEFGVAMGFLITGSMAGAATPDLFICMFGHSDNVGVTDYFRTFIPPFTVIEGTGIDADFIELEDAFTAFDLGDFDGNGLVNGNDLQVLLEQWLQTPGDPSVDIAPQPNTDNGVNLFDFSLFSVNYLPDDPFPQRELDNFTTDISQ